MKPADEMPRPAVSREDDERFMREALAEARAAAEVGEVPIGAVVVHKGTVIARAHNRRELDEDPSAHAEFLAMMQAARTLGRWRLSGCTVYVTLEPCLMCSGLMVNARIDRCVYGATDPKGGALGTLYDVSADARLNHSFDVTAGVAEDDCALLLREFFRGLRSPSGNSSTPLADGTSESASPARSSVSRLAGASNAVPARHFTTASSGLPLSPARRFVILAIDSFKGSATSAEAETWLSQGITAADPGLDVVSIPVADGGEGTMEAFQAALGGEVRTVTVTSLDGGAHEASYLMVDEGEAGSIAVIEMARAAGIAYSPRTDDAAMRATTRGVGELMLAAVASGAKTLYIGLGGSATTDGGVGMLQALGARIVDAAGEAVCSGLAGLLDVSEIDIAPARRALMGVNLRVLSDVACPLVGPRGAVRMFGPQKGLGCGLPEFARDARFRDADRRMAAYGALLTAARDSLDGGSLQVTAPGARPKSLAGVPGAGAAGGLGAALLALGAQLGSGATALLDLTSFDELARRACAVVTGEGSVDSQTAEGKVPACVARRAKMARRDIPVFAVCGSRSRDLRDVYEAGIDAVLPVGLGPQSLERALSAEQASADLIAMGETIARLIGARLA